MNFSNLKKNKSSKKETKQYFKHAIAAAEVVFIAVTSRERKEKHRIHHIWVILMMVFFVAFFQLVYSQAPKNSGDVQAKKEASPATAPPRGKIVLDVIEEADAEEQENVLKEEDVVEKIAEEKTGEKKSEKKAPPKKPEPEKKIISGFIAPGVVASTPNTFRKDSSGRLVCEKENDTPNVSLQDKPVHIDMECCLDIDEIPNPFCYYPAWIYGKMLDDYERKKDKMIKKYLNNKKL